MHRCGSYTVPAHLGRWPCLAHSITTKLRWIPRLFRTPMSNRHLPRHLSIWIGKRRNKSGGDSEQSAESRVVRSIQHSRRLTVRHLWATGVRPRLAAPVFGSSTELMSKPHQNGWVAPRCRSSVDSRNPKAWPNAAPACGCVAAMAAGRRAVLMATVCGRQQRGPLAPRRGNGAA